MLLQYLIKALVTAVAVLVAAKVVPGVRVRSFGSAFVFAIVLCFLNATLEKVLLVLGFPFLLMTLGLGYFVIHAFMFWLADKVVKDVEVDGFWAALFGSIITSLSSWAIMFLLHRI